MALSYKLLCLGNPLLDIQVNATQALLDKYNLKPNDAILAEEKHKPLYDELLNDPKAQLLPGGSAQNTARGAQYMLDPDSVVYMGCVGRDKYAEMLESANKQAGLQTAYRYDESEPTGRCGVVITGLDRSMCTDLAAANCFKLAHLKQNWSLAENATVLFTTGYHLTVSVDSMVALGEHAARTNKIFALSLSAPFLPHFFKDQLAAVMPFADYLVSSEEEYTAFAEANGLEDKSARAVASHIAGLPKENPNRKRTVIVTRGAESTIVVSDGQIQTYEARKVDKDDIKDTNGAGDAFAGGLLAGLVQGKELAVCLDMANWLASLEIQESGPAYPMPKQMYKA